MRTVVVGASSGLGRCIAIGLGERGDELALLARRHDRLVDTAKEIGSGALPIECDVTDADSCRSAIEEAVRGLGGIDGVVYAPGVGPLVRLKDADADTWRGAFDTNVIGAALLTAAAIPHLEASKGVAVYLSTVSASQTPPWPGLAVYGVTKAALDRLVEAWRAEHPQVGFTRVVVGDCMGGEGHSATEFNTGWDMDLAVEVMPIWAERHLLAGSLMEVEELIRVVDTVLHLGASASVPSVIVAPRPPA